MNASPNRAGERRSARRFIVIGLAAIWCGAAGVFAADPALADVTVRNDRGIYTVSAQFSVAQSGSTVLAVLTDYEHIPRFMPNVKTSIVRERSSDRVVVEQEAIARLMMFSKRIHLVLEVQADADTVRFRDACGRSFTRYEGTWTVISRDGHTVVSYELIARPSFDVPDFVLTRLLKRDARQMIEQLREEFAARSK